MKRPLKWVLLVAILALGGECRSEEVQEGHSTATRELKIRVTNQVLHPVRENLFGQFLEKPSWSNETGPEAALLPGTHQLDPRVEVILKAMDIPVVRFPGGTDVDHVDWRDMVTDAHGPGSGRPNSHGRHDKPIITNAFGYDEYLQLAGRLGWQSILVVNLRDGLFTDTPEAAAEHAAALLAYCMGNAATVPENFRQWPALRAANGHPEPYAVEYVQIGNESWFWTEALKKKYGEDWIEVWADRIEIYITALRRIAPGIRIIVDGYPLEISAELSRRQADIALYTLHRYYPMGIRGLYAPDGDTLQADEVTAKQIWDTLVHGTETDAAGLAEWQDKAIDQARNMGYQLAMTEWNLNAWWAMPVQAELRPGPGGRGLGAAGMLQALLRSGDAIALATQSMLVGKSWGIAGIRVAKDGVAPPIYAPTAQATTLYRKHHGDRRLKVHYESEVPSWRPEVCFFKEYRVTEHAVLVDVVATRDARNLYLHILNKDYDQEHSLTVQLEDLSVAGDSATLNRLRFLTRAEASPEGPWTSAETDSVPVTQEGFSVSLPYRSATIVVIPLDNRDRDR